MLAANPAAPGVVRALLSAGAPGDDGWLAVGEALSALVLTATHGTAGIQVSGPPTGHATLPVTIDVPGRL